MVSAAEKIIHNNIEKAYFELKDVKPIFTPKILYNFLNKKYQRVVIRNWFKDQIVREKAFEQAYEKILYTQGKITAAGLVRFFQRRYKLPTISKWLKYKKKMEQIFHDMYFSQNKAGGYSSAHKIFMALDKKYPQKYIQVWLLRQAIYSQFFPRKKSFPTRRIICHNRSTMLSADLGFLPKRYAIHNQGLSTFLLVINCFTKKIYIKVIPDKTGPTVLKAFREILESLPYRIKALRFDAGTEWVNKDFKKYLKKTKIKFFLARKGRVMGSSIAERALRSIKLILLKKLEHTFSNNWVDVISDVVKIYNNRYHSSIKATPEFAEKLINAFKIRKALYGEQNRLDNDAKGGKIFPIGTWVRKMRTDENIFAKESDSTFSQPRYKVIEIDRKQKPYMHILQDENRVKMRSKFYYKELVKVPIPQAGDRHRISKVVIRGPVQSKVRWFGYPARYDSYEPNENIEDLLG